VNFVEDENIEVLKQRCLLYLDGGDGSYQQFALHLSYNTESDLLQQILPFLVNLY